MLKPVSKRRHVLFVAIFLLCLSLLLALALEGAGVLSGQRELPSGTELFARLQVQLLGAGVFFVLSGFLPAYLILYALHLRKLHRLRRSMISAAVFSAAFVVLFFLVGESAGAYEAWLFVLGILSVVAADAAASRVFAERSAVNR
jgi:hypothetical protein